MTKKKAIETDEQFVARVLKKNYPDFKFDNRVNDTLVFYHKDFKSEKNPVKETVQCLILDDKRVKAYHYKLGKRKAVTTERVEEARIK